MILQALVRHYEDLVSRGLIAEEGWGAQKISYALHIDDDGVLMKVESLKEEIQIRNKTVFLPRLMDVPAATKRSSSFAPNFLWDNTTYTLGIPNVDKEKDSEEDIERLRQRACRCFEATRKMYKMVLSNTASPAAAAILQFYAKWDPYAKEPPAILHDMLEDTQNGCNVVFCYDGKFLHEVPEIRQAWRDYRKIKNTGEKITCLVTGKEDYLADTHPAIKGVPGAQSSGAVIVTANRPSFWSYGRKQGEVAPTGQYAAFAYTAALNNLIADRSHIVRIGDTLVLAWAEGADPVYKDVWAAALEPERSPFDQDVLHEMLETLLRGDLVDVDDTQLDPNRRFYILGISPNAARLSIRFFLQSTFGDLLHNAAEHQKRLEIVKASYDHGGPISIGEILGETFNQKATNKAPSPVLAGELARAILMNARYPATLLNAVRIRMRADHTINRNRAAIIKAYYLQNPDPAVPKEVLTVALNPESTSIPYQLGRLFATLEHIQDAANPGINTTIKDKYFNSACATPAAVFPILVNLAQKHLRKIGGGLAVILDRQLIEIMSNFDAGYPAVHTLPEQGAFQLGYYHQVQARYTKKEEK